MRFLQRIPVARLILAVLPGALVLWAGGRGGLVAFVVLLASALTVLAFVVLTIAPDAIALQRRHHWRWW